MKISVVIVNYNVKYFLAQCLHSLFKSLKGVEFEVFVIDNASVDSSKEYITQHFPQVTYIYNIENVGFAKANNQAIRLSKGEYILLLNPDTILPENNIEEVLFFMDSNQDVGACGVKMLSPTGGFLPESKRGYPSPSVSFWRLTGIHRLFPNNKYFDGYYLSYLDKEEKHSVPILAGAYMMLRSGALNKSGLLDEDFFMYGEDIDLSYRIIETGFKNYYLPNPILHYKGESTSKNSYKYVRVFYGAMGIFFKKHGKDYSPLSRCLVQMGISLQTWTKLLMVAIKRKQNLLYPKQSIQPCFIIISKNDGVNRIKAILDNNKLGKGCLHLNSIEEASVYLQINNSSQQGVYSHIIYDVSKYSYSEIIDGLERSAEYNVQIGIYNPTFQNIITPGEVYV